MQGQQNEQELIYGTRAVIEALRAGRELERLFVQRGLHNALFRELQDELKEHGVHYQLVPREKLDRLTRQNHQGVIAFVSSLSYYQTADVLTDIFQKGKVPLLLMLDRVTDTRNLGAIARTAEGAGVHAIIVPSRGSAMINADAIKTSAGALHHIPVCREDNLKDTINYLRDAGVQVVACSEKTSLEARDADYSLPTAIIMGSEENGVSPEYIKRCDRVVKLPMHGLVESYNVSAAAAMILYEVMRQRS
jgi:23S rRNA (guanosine2251-2'-O)-methyltransferase